MSSIFKEILGRAAETPDVDQAIASWRNAPGRGEGLSEEARRRILAAIRPASSAPGRLAPLASLFVPARRALVAAIVPVLLVGLSVALFLVASPQPMTPLAAAGVQVEAHKVDGEVVFVIANGGSLIGYFARKARRPAPNPWNCDLGTGRFATRSGETRTSFSIVSIEVELMSV